MREYRTRADWPIRDEGKLYIREFVRLHNLNPIGVLHVGAHQAEESDEYLQNGFADANPIIWIEAQNELVEVLRSKLDPTRNKVYCGVAWDEDGIKKVFNLTSKSASSSLFELEKHTEFYPEIDVVRKIEVTTSRIDTLLTDQDIFDFVVLDIQGAESQAITGLGRRIGDVKWIYTEVSDTELYAGATNFAALEIQMKELGFIRVFTAWDRRAGWGDALYARTNVYNISRKQNLLVQISAIKRFCRSYIPNWAFPVLVKLKRFVKRIS
jgi:FkbM family methyltransferase